MRIGHWSKTFILACFFSGLAASAQTGAQTDAAASLMGVFSGASRGNGVVQSPSDAAGLLLELRHISSPLSGYELSYAYNRANQTYKQDCATVSNCTSSSPAAVSANAHQISGAWLASVHIVNIRPFVLAGLGLQFNNPAAGQSKTAGASKPVVFYGLGGDWGLGRRAGLRFQYRKNVYKAPGLTSLYSSTGSFTSTTEIAAGYYFRF
jgi:hypothetical protein